MCKDFEKEDSFIDIRLDKKSTLSFRDNIECLETECPQSVSDFKELLLSLTKKRNVITVLFLPDSRSNQVTEYKIKNSLSEKCIYSNCYKSENGKFFVGVSNDVLCDMDFGCIVTSYELYAKAEDVLEDIICVLNKHKEKIAEEDTILNFMHKLAQIKNPSAVIYYALNYVRITINPKQK